MIKGTHNYFRVVRIHYRYLKMTWLVLGVGYLLTELLVR